MTDIPPPMYQQRAQMLPHRGGTILTLGIVSLSINVISALGGAVFAPCCMMSIIPIATGIPAWVMANRDLRLMAAGQMDPAGMSGTSAGKVCAIISVIMSAVGVLLTIVMLVLGVAFFAAAASGAASGI